MKKFKEFINESLEIKDISNLISLLFQSRDIAHIAHLSTGSYAQHKALNEYYDSLLSLIDIFAEAYQGIKGKIKIIIPQSIDQDIIAHLTDLSITILEIRNDELEEQLQAILDDILELISTTIYKLKELK